MKSVSYLLKEYTLPLFLSLLAFFLTRYAVTYGAGSDPRYTLIVAQSIIDNGTIQLNAYQSDQIWGAPADFDGDINILEYDGRYYNYFPVGPSLLSVPFVLITKSVGWDMRLSQDNINAQRLLSSFSIIVIFWLVFLNSRLFLPQRESLIIAAFSFFGSTLISTLGVALWSLNFSVVFIGLSLWLILQFDLGKTDTVQPRLLGVLLFLAFFCRAASAAFILPLLIYLYLKDRRQMLATAIVAATLLALFFLWSRSEFGTWLPIYYSVARLQLQRTPLWLALAGHLFSPARGLIIFSPFLILLIPAFFHQHSYLLRNYLVWLCLLWIAIHLFIASSAAIWWGGHSFGPRLLTELMLAFALLSALYWQQARKDLTRHRRRLWLTTYLLLGTMAVIIHSYQGLYNYSTAVWNSVIIEHPAPPVTSRYGDLFNWHIPQFWASNPMLCRLEEERTRAALTSAPLLTPYPWGTPLSYGPDKLINLSATANWLRGESDYLPTYQALFVGWEPVDNDRAPHRAAACTTLHILFIAGGLSSDKPIRLTISSAAFGRQSAIFTLNQRPIGRWTFQQQPSLASETAVLLVDPQRFYPDSLNDLAIHLPDGQRASYYDPTRLSLAIESISFSP